MKTVSDGPLATFVDRHTMVYERVYAHSIERVWDAVSTASHLDVWMLPETKVERRLGGTCGFGWGGPAEELATVTVWEPPTTVEYTHGDGSYMRFDLEAHDAHTMLRFTMHFLPAPNNAPVDGDPGGDLPGGLDTAWRPGFLAGFHDFVDRLGPYLSGEWSLEDTRRELERTVSEGFDAEELALQARYRQHILDTIPPA
jgi:hypothetical protein